MTTAGAPPPYEADHKAPSTPPAEVDDDTRSMDDERRSLPEGWVRAFDERTKHHFYVETATNRTMWTHPYDDAQVINALPVSHPANPASKQAQEAAHRGEAEAQESEKNSKKSGVSKWFAERTDEFLHGEATQREAIIRKKAVREAKEDFLRRKAILSQGRTDDPSIQALYAPNPLGSMPPKEPYARTASSLYAYGYPKGYGRRFAHQGDVPKQVGAGNGGWKNGWLAEAGVNVSPACTTPKTNYGFSG